MKIVNSKGEVKELVEKQDLNITLIYEGAAKNGDTISLTTDLKEFRMAYVIIGGINTVLSVPEFIGNNWVIFGGGYSFNETRDYNITGQLAYVDESLYKLSNFKVVTRVNNVFSNIVSPYITKIYGIR